MLFSYIIRRYLKLFFIVFISLELFYVVIDTIQHINKLPNSANLFVLFLFYDFSYAMNFMFPISILLSLVILLYLLIKENELITILSLGYSKQAIAKIFFFISFFLTLFFVILFFTPFAYSKENLDAILNNRYFVDVKNGIFLKYKNQYIYFERFYPIQNRAVGVKIYDMQNDKLSLIISSKEAIFSNDSWILKDAKIIQVPASPILSNTPLVFNYGEVDTLDGFRPNILKGIFEDDLSMSILELFSLIKLLKNDHIETNKPRSLLYSLILFPFFAPAVGILLLFLSPNIARFNNLSLTLFLGVLISLSFWGLFFGLSKLSFSGLISPELGVVLPLLIVFFISFVLYNKLSLR